MALVSEKPKQVYDLSKIKAGWLFYGRHKTWEEGKAGIVTSARENELVVQYYPGIANVTNHFIIPAAEVYAGEWEIRWSGRHGRSLWGCRPDRARTRFRARNWAGYGRAGNRKWGSGWSLTS